VDFTVELEALGALGKDLQSCGETLGGALDALKQAGDGGLGRHSLDDACEEVQGDWRHGLSLVKECSEKLAGGVQDSAKAYAQVEDKTAESFTKVAGQL
jgi:hypothetical protein